MKGDKKRKYLSHLYCHCTSNGIDRKTTCDTVQYSIDSWKSVIEVLTCDMWFAHVPPTRRDTRTCTLCVFIAKFHRDFADALLYCTVHMHKLTELYFLLYRTILLYNTSTSTPGTKRTLQQKFNGKWQGSQETVILQRTVPVRVPARHCTSNC